MPRYHNINGENVQFTPEEEIARDAEEQAWADGTAARAAERVQVSRRAAYQLESDPMFFEAVSYTHLTLPTILLV